MGLTFLARVIVPNPVREIPSIGSTRVRFSVALFSKRSPYFGMIRKQLKSKNVPGFVKPGSI